MSLPLGLDHGGKFKPFGEETLSKTASWRPLNYDTQSQPSIRPLGSTLFDYGFVPVCKECVSMSGLDHVGKFKPRDKETSQAHQSVYGWRGRLLIWRWLLLPLSATRPVVAHASG